jgi:hypothetical protein
MREEGVKVAASLQRRRPLRFIHSETQQSKFLNPTVKNEGIWVIQAGVSGTDAGGYVFFHLDSQSPDFAGLGLHQGKRLAIEGLLLGGFGIRLFIRRIERSFKLARINSKGSTAKPR